MDKEQLEKKVLELGSNRSEGKIMSKGASFLGFVRAFF